MNERVDKRRYEQGFTLLELVVVVIILAVLGSMAVSSFGTGSGSVQTNAKIQAARFEMEQIRQALLKYKQDVGNFNGIAQTSPADFRFMFNLPTAVTNWNIDYQNGWRGPYLSGGDSGLVDVGDALLTTGSGTPYNIYINAITLIRGVPDPFTFSPVANDNPGSAFTSCIENDAVGVNDDCLLDWRFVGQLNSDAPHDKYGRPYLLFDLDQTDARIVSMGLNGKYDLNQTLTCPPNLGNTDDLVLCLY